MCDHPRSSAPGLLLLPRSSSLHDMPHLPPAHHETNKHDSPNETKIKEKQNKIVLNFNSNLTKSMTHHNQTKELTTWFLKVLPLNGLLLGLLLHQSGVRVDLQMVLNHLPGDPGHL
jgi:hypothetical protein